MVWHVVHNEKSTDIFLCFEWQSVHALESWDASARASNCVVWQAEQNGFSIED